MTLFPPIKFRSTLPLIAVAVAAVAAVAAWIAQPQSVLRTALACGSLTVVCLVQCWRQRRQDQNQDVARRFLLTLSQLDEMDLLDDGARHLPALPKSSRWGHICQAICRRLEEAAQLTHGAEQGKAQAELRVHKLDGQRRRATDALESLPAPVIAVNQYDEVMLANPAACDLFHVEEDPRGKLLADISPTAALTELVASARRRGASSHRSSHISWTDESGEQHYRANCRCLTRQGADIGAVAVLENVADRLALQRRNAEFVSAASHEIKTPLAGIKAYVELLVDGDLPDDGSSDQIVEVIDAQADRLQRLIDNLLNLARIEAGVERVEKSSRSLNELLEDGLRVVQPAAEKKSINLQNDLSPMYLGVLADRDMLLQAAINLLSNAVKYTPESGSVTLRSRLEDTRVSFEVEDTGIGLSEEDCRRVFEKFYRAQNGDMAPGTGLGLTLAKHIVEDVHGGALSVTSEPGKGTIFRVTLPGHVQSRREIE